MRANLSKDLPQMCSVVYLRTVWRKNSYSAFLRCGGYTSAWLVDSFIPIKGQRRLGFEAVAKLVASARADSICPNVPSEHSHTGLFMYRRCAAARWCPTDPPSTRFVIACKGAVLRFHFSSVQSAGSSRSRADQFFECFILSNLRRITTVVLFPFGRLSGGLGQPIIGLLW